MPTIPLAAIEKLAKKAGVERISDDAVKEIEKILEEMGSKLAFEAADLAKHANRKTITADDIKMLRTND